MKDIIAQRIEQMLRNRQSAIVAIDGPCGAGKSTLGKSLQEQFDCNLFHMDDFFLPIAGKTPERLKIPGNNVDRERFLAEVLLPLKERKPFAFRPFDCKAQALGGFVEVPVKTLNVVEGSYSHHPTLANHYDLKIFLDISPEAQRRRILERSGEEMLKRFVREWIPPENEYFTAFNITKNSDCYFHCE
jgi:Uridine kinase